MPTAATIDPTLTYVPPTPKLVSTMVLNESSYLPKDYVVADSAFGLYVASSAPVFDNPIEGYLNLILQSDGYHLIIPSDDASILQDPSTNYSSNSLWTPIVGFTIV